MIHIQQRGDKFNMRNFSCKKCDKKLQAEGVIDSSLSDTFSFNCPECNMYQILDTVNLRSTFLTGEPLLLNNTAENNTFLLSEKARAKELIQQRKNYENELEETRLEREEKARTHRAGATMTVDRERPRRSLAELEVEIKKLQDFTHEEIAKLVREGKATARYSKGKVTLTPTTSEKFTPEIYDTQLQNLQPIRKLH